MSELYRMSRTEALLLALLLALALGARLDYVLRIDGEPFSDMAHYDKLARSLLRGEGFRSDGRVTAYRPPAYPAFVALVYGAFGTRPAAVRAIQAVLSTLTCGLWFFAARRFLRVKLLETVRVGTMPFSSLGALGAVGVLALYDEWIFFTGQLLTETVYAFLLTIWLLAWLGWLQMSESSEKRRRGAFAAIGLLASLLTLTRPVALFSILPVLGLALWREKKRSPGKPIAWLASVFILGWLSLCLPWMVRNAIHFGPLTGLSTNTGVNFYIGHNAHFGYWSTGDKQHIREITDLNESEESRLFLKMGCSYLSRHPVATVKHTLVKLEYLFLEPWRPWALPGQSALDPWNPFSRRHIQPYKPWPWFDQGRELPPKSGFLFPLIEWDLPLILLVLIGFVLALLDRAPWGLLYATMGGQVAAYLVFFARARFRMPLGVMFSLLAAYAILRAAARLLKRQQAQ